MSSTGFTYLPCLVADPRLKLGGLSSSRPSIEGETGLEEENVEEEDGLILLLVGLGSSSPPLPPPFTLSISSYARSRGDR